MPRRKLSPEHIEQIRETLLRKWSDPVFKEAQRQKHIGFKHTEETKRKMSLAKKGKKLPPEVVAKIIESRRGTVLTPEARLNISYAARKRSRMTDETRERLSIAASAYYARKKLEKENINV